jgi:hypothetical protein
MPSTLRSTWDDTTACALGECCEDEVLGGRRSAHFRSVHTRRWNDQGGLFTWTEPSGWSSANTPLAYFNTERVIEQLVAINNAGHRGWMEWANTGGRFSDQVCAKKRAVAHCSQSGHCTRWGLHYNNECDFTSNDAMNGLGMNIGGRTAGDWDQCCLWWTGSRRAMSVMLWARV